MNCVLLKNSKTNNIRRVITVKHREIVVLPIRSKVSRTLRMMVRKYYTKYYDRRYEGMRSDLPDITVYPVVPNY